MSFSRFTEKAENGTLTESEVTSYCEKYDLSLDQFAHEFSKSIVQNYSGKIYSYSFAVQAMNWIFSFMTDNAYLNSSNNAISEFPLNGYLTFGAGEYHRFNDPKSADRIERYTNPKIRKLLNEINS